MFYVPKNLSFDFIINEDFIINMVNEHKPKLIKTKNDIRKAGPGNYQAIIVTTNGSQIQVKETTLHISLYGRCTENESQT